MTPLDLLLLALLAVGAGAVFVRWAWRRLGLARWDLSDREAR